MNLFIQFVLSSPLCNTLRLPSNAASTHTESSSTVWFPLREELFALSRRPSSSGSIDAEQGCGFNIECPLDYNTGDIEAMSENQRKLNETASHIFQEVHAQARDACKEGTVINEHGGWCYAIPAKGKKITENTDIPYYLSKGHNIADDGFVSGIVASKLLLKKDGSCCGSLTDFGAGVGQFGHALRVHLPNLEYLGYDGAGNVEEFTSNYTHFTDLTQPLNLKRTDWVLSSEVGEHIPHIFEKQVIANIHAHNCKGVILTWAVLGQHGTGHVNNHSNEYLVKIFQELGYLVNENITQLLRESALEKHWWLKKSSIVLERLKKPAECSN